MKTLKEISFLPALLLAVIILNGISHSVYSQTPEVLDNGTLKEQFDYLNERTLIYNNFRAIREDMFQKVRRNSVDSLRKSQEFIVTLNTRIAELEQQVSALNQQLETTGIERDEAIKDRDSLFLLGKPMNKTFYNVLLWSIIGSLLVLLAIGFLLFKRTRKITVQKTTELDELREEYETYRKTSRERFEQQSIDHFNEIKRLKGRL